MPVRSRSRASICAMYCRPLSSGRAVVKPGVVAARIVPPSVMLSGGSSRWPPESVLATSGSSFHPGAMAPSAVGLVGQRFACHLGAGRRNRLPHRSALQRGIFSIDRPSASRSAARRNQRNLRSSRSMSRIPGKLACGFPPRGWRRAAARPPRPAGSRFPRGSSKGQQALRISRPPIPSGLVNHVQQRGLRLPGVGGEDGLQPVSRLRAVTRRARGNRRGP